LSDIGTADVPGMGRYSLLSALCGERSRGSFCFLMIESADYDSCAMPQELASNGKADSAACASDDCDCC